MKVLNELLGFAVLTGPLWLILIVLPIAIWIAMKAPAVTRAVRLTTTRPMRSSSGWRATTALGQGGYQYG